MRKCCVVIIVIIKLFDGGVVDVCFIICDCVVIGRFDDV